MTRKKPKTTFSWLNPKLEVRPAPKYGKGEKGVFAKKLIKKSEMVCIFGGYVMTVKEEINMPNFRDEAFQISENFVLGVKKESELEDACYFNHSCNPNVGFKGQIFLVAMRDIKESEELLFDYAMVLHSVKGVRPYKMRCKCGKNNCRGIIGVNDWKKKDLQKKYKGYFQWYLQEKINNKNKN